MIEYWDEKVIFEKNEKTQSTSLKILLEVSKLCSISNIFGSVNCKSALFLIPLLIGLTLATCTAQLLWSTGSGGMRSATKCQKIHKIIKEKDILS